MKKVVIVLLTTCFLVLAVAQVSHAQYSECPQSGVNTGSCSASSGDNSTTSNSAGGWVLTAPTGYLYYAMSIQSYNSYANTQAIIWGDGPNENIYTTHPYDSDSRGGTLSGLSSTLYVDVEVWATNGYASINVSTW